MVDWNSAQVIAKNVVSFDRLIHCLYGLYIWEWVISLDFDWGYISRRRAFRWPMAFYFLNRYCLLAAMTGVVVALNITQKIDCQALYTFNQCFGNASIGLASVNLSLRTMAVWSQKRYIVVPLTLVILGHWSLLLHGVLLKAKWVDGQGCTIVETNSKLLAITFIYSMAFDLLVLLLTAFKLLYPATGRSRLVALIFNDGLIYFVIAFLVNFIATVFMLLNLNPVMSIIANVPAAIASTIVATRVVRRLSNFACGVQVSTQGSTIRLGFGRSTTAWGVRSNKISTGVVRSEGVHVQMETLQTQSPIDNYVEEKYVDETGGNADPEAQVINKDFKPPLV